MAGMYVRKKKRRPARDGLVANTAVRPDGSVDFKSGGYRRKSEAPRFKGKQVVDAATAARTKRRFKRLGITLGPGEITGYQARYAKRKLRKRRDERTTYSI